VPARLMGRGPCSPDTPYLEPNEWLITFSYRHYHSFRDYQGGKKLPVPSPPEYYASTYMNGFDLAVSYAFNKRFSLSFELPLSKATRESYYEHDFVSKHTMRASGYGDVRVSGNYWLLKPESHPRHNVSLRVGVKIPSGNHEAKDLSYRDTGPIPRPVDPAIQPGDGGWGLVLGTDAFKRVSKRTVFYALGTYLSNPREMNGTETPFGDQPGFTLGDIGYIINSVPDQYFAQAGVSHTFWKKQGVSATFGLRTDGVPPGDIIGGREGWRIPGYSISVEPGFTVEKGKHFFTFTVPITVKGHGSTNVADARNNSPLAGIVSLADSQIVVSYSRRF